MSNRTGNLQIEKAIRNIGDEDLDDNFVGVFPSNHMNKFINHAAIRYLRKKEKYTRYRAKNIFFLGLFWTRWFETFH